MIGRSELADLLPHAPPMVLLDAVQEWDDRRVACLASNHRRDGHPLRNPLGVPAVAALEYAFQAMLVHAALIKDGKALAGRLGSVRRLMIEADWLDRLPGMLTIEADLRLKSPQGLIYAFAVHCGDVMVMDGEATLYLNASRS